MLINVRINSIYEGRVSDSGYKRCSTLFLFIRKEGWKIAI